MASMCNLSWSGPVRRLLMAPKSKMFRNICKYTSTESMISTGNTDQIGMNSCNKKKLLFHKKRSAVPLKGLNLFSRSNSCLPNLDRSMRRSGQMAYSSSVRLTWEIFSITVSVEGPAARRNVVSNLNDSPRSDSSTFSVPTSVCHVELDPEVSGGASGAMAGCEDDPTYGLDLPDDAGNSRGGQEAIVSDHQPTDLKKRWAASTNVTKEIKKKKSLWM